MTGNDRTRSAYLPRYIFTLCSPKAETQRHSIRSLSANLGWTLLQRDCPPVRLSTRLHQTSWFATVAKSLPSLRRTCLEAKRKSRFTPLPTRNLSPPRYPWEINNGTFVPTIRLTEAQWTTLNAFGAASGASAMGIWV